MSIPSFDRSFGPNLLIALPNRTDQGFVLSISFSSEVHVQKRIQPGFLGKGSNFCLQKTPCRALGRKVEVTSSCSLVRVMQENALPD